MMKEDISMDDGMSYVARRSSQIDDDSNRALCCRDPADMMRYECEWEFSLTALA